MTEVAARFGVSRQSVHAWLVRYRESGSAGLDLDERQAIAKAPPALMRLAELGQVLL